MVIYTIALTGSMINLKVSKIELEPLTRCKKEELVVRIPNWRLPKIKWEEEITEI